MADESFRAVSARVFAEHDASLDIHGGTSRKGDRWPRQALIAAAEGATRTKGTYLRAQEDRLARRRAKRERSCWWTMLS
jgi:hypothetical protein